MAEAERNNLWELAVLAFLRERPTHPYEMQRLLRERHKDELLVLKRGSLYHAIRRLLGAGLIDAAGTERAGRRPERTTYRITAAGRKTLTRWIEEMLGTPKAECPEFMAAMSFLVYVTPREAAARLTERLGLLEQSITELESTMAAVGHRVERINLIELEYVRAMRKAELAWVRGLIEELRSKRLHWDLTTILRGAT